MCMKGYELEVDCALLEVVLLLLAPQEKLLVEVLLPLMGEMVHRHQRRD